MTWKPPRDELRRLILMADYGSADHLHIPLKARLDSEGKRGWIPIEKAGPFRRKARLDSVRFRAANPVRKSAWIPQAGAPSFALA
jgi:hypothetical protein